MLKYFESSVNTLPEIEFVKTALSFLLVIIMATTECVAQELRRGDCASSHLELVSSRDCNAFEHGDWVLVFEDEFNGDELDTEKWFTCEDGWNRFHGGCNAELQCYLDDNIKVNNGILSLIAKRENPGFHRPDCDEILPYSSGWIQTKTKFKYGLIEARCRVPKGKGFWPAFWLFGHNREIDIFEIYGNETDKVHTDMHNWYGIHTHCPQESRVENIYDDFHVYRIEWDEFKISYSVDGHIIREQYKYTNTSGQSIPNCHTYARFRYLYALNIFPDSPQSIIFNLAISSSDEHPKPDDATPFPSSFDIDYVRVFKKNNENMNLVVSSYNPDNVNYITGGSICFFHNSGINIQNGAYLKCIATHEIIICPDFHAEYGSEFSATIEHLPTRGDDNDNMQYVMAMPRLSQDDTENEERLKLFPNPTTGPFTLILKEEESTIEDVIIEDGCGRIVIEKTNIGETNYTTSLHKSGLYYARVRTGNGTVHLKKILVK